MEQCPYANHHSLSSSLMFLMGTFMSNSSGIWASGDFVDVFVGWHTTRLDCSYVVLGGVSEGMIQLVYSGNPWLMKLAGKFNMEQNDTGCQAPQAPVLCVNNCGFFGTAATMNMCSKCYKDMIFRQEQANFAASSIESLVNGSSSTSVKAVDVAVTVQERPAETLVIPTQVAAPVESEQVEKAKEGPPNRCSTCRRRVGLTGFNCRCGNLFCSAHRYSDKHECPYDYRKAGQDAIAKANPVVKAEKLEKI